MQSYVVRTKKFKSGDEYKMRYYGVPVTSGQIDDEYLAKEISERSSLTEPDVLAAIASLKVLMRKYLKHGNTVRLKGIGLFSVSASSQGFDTPEECTDSTVKAQRICFKADDYLRGVLPEIKYQKVNRGSTKRVKK